MAPDPGTWAPGTTGQGAGYGANFWHVIRFALAPDGSPLRPATPPVSGFSRPSEIFVVADSLMYWIPTGGWKTVLSIDCPVHYPWDLLGGDPWGTSKQIPGRHAGLGNLAFIDGHVEGRRHESLRANAGNVFACDEDGDGTPDW